MSKILLIIGLVWPEPKSSAAGTRMLQLIDLFKKQDFDVVFASAAQESDFSFDLKSIGVATQKIKLNSSSFDEFITELKPEIVLFDRYIIEEQFGWRVHENCPNAIRILDTEDLHCLRLGRQNAVKKNMPFEISNLLNSDIAKREIASIYRCDLTLMVSEFEMEVLNSIFKIDKSLLHYLPIFYANINAEEIPNFQERKDFVFIGNFLHEPNFDAVKQIKEKIWSKISKQLPEASIYIYGAYPSQKVLQLHNEKEKFYVHGRAENADIVIKNAKVLLAPLRFGAGLKGKLLEAMIVGTPTITTNIGCEGISNNNYWNGFITDDFDDFVVKSIELYNNENLWINLQKNGFEIINNKFKMEFFEQLFSKKLNQIKSNIVTHRSQNFFGNLLIYHSNLSTKYMSKWIEEKNK
ncbi:glycosyltransferase family 4 protein [Flavobacterium sp.]|uniref:glycosyltransferase family 4 protein n=1 Tax=Flavobacterium sp. TaxID=239 RepID=UPI00286A53BE|nr:glycosyltransferase family 4 protein [Flavobacterium sp.]